MRKPSKNQNIKKFAEAPTPQNTPASVPSFIGRAKPNIGATISEDPLPTDNNLLSHLSDKLGSVSLQPKGRKPTKTNPNVKRALYALQRQCDLLERELEKRVMDLEKKYHIKTGPLYERRKEIIKGIEEPTGDEIVRGIILELEDEDDRVSRLEEIVEDEENEVEKTDIKGIPNFWAIVLSNMPEFADSISTEDMEALQYLTDIRMEYLDEDKGEGLGFKLIFEFAKNEFFSNASLVNTYYYYGPNMGLPLATHVKSCVGDTIKWKSLKNKLTVEVVTKKRRHTSTGAIRKVKVEMRRPSFFHFFDPLRNDEKYVLIEPVGGVDKFYYQGNAIKDMLPRAVDWFTGEALEYNDAFDGSIGYYSDEDYSDDY